MPEPGFISPLGFMKDLRRALESYREQNLKPLIDTLIKNTEQPKEEAQCGLGNYSSSVGQRQALLAKAATSPWTANLMTEFEQLEKCLQQKVSGTISPSERRLYEAQAKDASQLVKIVKEREASASGPRK